MIPQKGCTYWICAYQWSNTGGRCSLNQEPIEVVFDGYNFVSKDKKSHSEYRHLISDTEQECKRMYTDRLNNHVNVILRNSVRLIDNKSLLKRMKKFNMSSKVDLLDKISIPLKNAIDDR